MAISTLNAIIKKVRRLTRSPSEQQISSYDITEYVNTFIQYDFPQELRLFSFRKTLTFYTEPNIDVYESNSITDDPLENFNNKYTGVYTPAYIAGYKAFFSQSEEEFYNLYPLINFYQLIGTGTGVNTVNGTLTDVPVLRNSVVFGTTEVISGDTMKVYDDGDGNLIGDVAGPGTIDYITGVFTIEFTGSVEVGANIDSFYVPYAASRPDSILYFDNKFKVRPVPDKVYPIQIEVDLRPTELEAGDEPELEQWWQYIAYGAAKKVFEDRSDMESIQELMPEFEHQRLLVLRRTYAIQSKERAATIYSEGAWIGYGGRWPYSERQS